MHRRSLDLPILLQYLRKAETFATLYSDTEASAKVPYIATRIQAIYNNIKQRRSQLVDNIQLTMCNIHYQQAALEKTAQAEVVRAN